MSALPHPRALTELPLDVLIGVFAHLDPYNIHAVRGVCRYLCLVTQERPVWIQALQRICYDMNVGLGTYSVEHMTTFEIEQASVAPFRFVDLLDKHLGRGQPLFPCATRAIRPRRDVLREDQRFLLHELAPGGRWLFTLTEDACVHLWDLNADNNSSTLTMPTGSWVHPRGSDCAETVMEIQIHNTIAYLLLTCELSGDELTLHVLKIEPNSALPQFEVFRYCSTLDMRGFRESLFTNDSVAVTAPTACLVWNWVKDEWIKLKVRQPWSLMKPFLINQQIMAWQDIDPETHEFAGRLAVWDIPKLVPRTNSQPTLHKLATPSHVIAPPTVVLEGTLVDPSRVYLPYGRENGPIPKLHVLSPVEEFEDFCGYITYQFDRNQDQPDDRPATCVPVLSRTLATPYPKLWWNPNRSFVTIPLVDGRDLVVTHADNNGAPMTAFILPYTDPGSSGIAALDIGGVEEGAAMFMWVEPKFDAVSGRCCVPKSAREVEIREYITKQA